MIHVECLFIYRSITLFFHRGSLFSFFLEHPVTMSQLYKIC